MSSAFRRPSQEKRIDVDVMRSLWLPIGPRRQPTLVDIMPLTRTTAEPKPSRGIIPPG
jgi:hypothetical protein